MSFSQSHSGPRPVRGDIVESWKRSRQHGVDADRLEVAQADADFDSSFVSAGAPVLYAMTDLLSGTSTSLALADPAGSVIWRWESESDITALLDTSEFELGSQLAEPAAGTNGIGLAIADRRPARVIGREHYKEQWRMWACFAAPVFHPVTAELLGLVNIACRAEDANHFLSVALRSLTDGIRSAIRDGISPRERNLLEVCQLARRSTRQPVIALDRTIMLTDDKSAPFRLDRSSLWSAVVDAGPRRCRIYLGDGVSADCYPVADRSLSDGVVLVLNSFSDPHPALEDSTTLLRTTSERGRLRHAEVQLIRSTLEECRGNKSKTAAMLGISRGTLYHRIRQYKIDG
ncbi:hypothetical protein HQO26_18610 [Rhodococcus fascians]|nr:hypothetical protein [Rhodococcus fascians]MBY4414760.1 hypothetical protein [Rhodococcus fascians]